MMRSLAPWLTALTMSLSVVLLAPAPTSAAPSEQPFEITPGSFHFAPASDQAGAHADWSTEFDLAHSAAGHTYNDMRSVTVNLPPGFMASDTAVPTCTFDELRGNPSFATEEARAQPPWDGTSTACPPASQVGTITLDLTGFHGVGSVQRDTFPLYNMQATSYGVTAELAFRAVFVTQVLLVKVRPGDMGLSVTTPNVETIGEPHAIKVVTWGVPWSASHDTERGLECFPEPEGGRGRPNPEPGGAECYDGGEKVEGQARPFQADPTSCGMFHAGMEASSWEHPEEWSSALAETGPVDGCDRVHFDPVIEAQPTTRSAESPSGLNITLSVPQTWETAESLATSTLKDAQVTLPAGYTVNPSAGSGLAGCTPAQYEAETYSSPPGAGCPPESKLGTVSIETPLLDERIDGNVYLAMPYDNPFGEPGNPGGSLLALYVVAKDPGRGIIVKTAGKVEPNPLTGQLTTTFKDTPQQPFSHFTFRFRQGATSPLVSPPACGTYTINAGLTPWSAPAEVLQQSARFQIEDGIGGGPCPAGGSPPFAPRVVAGTASNAAGAYSPFYLDVARNDGEQEIAGFSTIMPAGLTGNLTGIPFCPDAAIEAARARTGEHGGREELEAPSCPAASRIGHTIVEAGVGSVLAQNPGSLYLGGPYRGAPFSLVSITSATVGPFDLGTVVIRFGLQINPLTAQVEVSPTGSEPIPHIIKGIVTHVRDIRAYIDRPGFIKNPTSCEHFQIQNQVQGADGATASLTSPFQDANCASLQFAPKFTVTTTGKTSKSDGASLSVKLAYPSAPQGTQSNIHQVKVELPVQLPSRLTTLQKACTAAQFHTNPAGCPAVSVVGHARAITPILPVPLEGPAYFVSNGGEAFPNLILVLQGYGVTIDLVGDTFISKAGITSSTFKTVPDQPVTSFELTLPQGPFSALTANGDLCALTRTVLVKKKVTVRTKGRRRTITRRVRQTLPTSLSMPTEFVAQNGAVIHQTTPVSVTNCPKAVHAKKKARKTRRRKKK